MAIKFSDLCDITLYKFFELAWSETATGRVSQRNLQMVKPGPLSDALLFKAINELVNQETLTAISVRDTLVYSISKPGIEYVEEEMGKDDSVISAFRKKGIAMFNDHVGARPPIAPDAWKAPDYRGVLDAAIRAAVVDRLRAMHEGMPDVVLVEDEKAQATARVAAALALAEAPVPPWGKVLDIIEPLTELAPLAAGAKEVVARIS